jgi:hypothetical protein
LQCNFSNLNALDLSNNPDLQFLYAQGNSLSSLNLTGNPGLFIVNLDNNQLNTIDFSGNPLLDFLFCRGNDLVHLDLSSNVNLRRLDCKSNSLLTYINLKNGNNNNLLIDGAQASNFEELPLLETVCLDDANSSLATYITTQVGHSVTYIEDCTLGILENNNLSFFVYPNPVQDILYLKTFTPIVIVDVNSLNGQLLAYASKTTQIDISSFSPGIYFLRIVDSMNFEEIQKIIKY